MIRYIIYITILFSTVACVDVEEYNDTPRGNFEALWHIIDERYCFLDYKSINWNDVYTRYSTRVTNNISDDNLFEILSDMLAELKDGHVNLYSTFNIGRNWSFRENYPYNYDERIIDKYLGTKYRIVSGMKYVILDNNIGYLRCKTLNTTFGNGGLDAILSYFMTCNGLIIDLRGNPGGLVTTAAKLAARFTNEETLVGYIQHKVGKGHSDFSEMQAQYIAPSNGIRWQKKVVVLTDREVYSAANEFVKYMRCFPNVTIIGDKTGGGSGMPFTSELPNGWAVRFSAVPIYDKNKQNTEFGIEPDTYILLSASDTRRGIDTVIETAKAKFR